MRMAAPEYDWLIKKQHPRLGTKQPPPQRSPLCILAFYKPNKSDRTISKLNQAKSSCSVYTLQAVDKIRDHNCENCTGSGDPHSFSKSPTSQQLGTKGDRDSTISHVVLHLASKQKQIREVLFYPRATNENLLQLSGEPGKQVHH